MNESSVAPESTDIASVHKSNKQKLIWGLVCLLGPTALIIVSLLLYAIMNFIFVSAEPTPVLCPGSINSGLCATPNIDQTGVLGMQGPLKMVLNVVLFLIGAVATLTWLPGIIVGIILLVTRKPVPAK